MNSLESQFQNLNLFCQMNWDEVTTEYENFYLELSFPEYLQQKAQEGDCPDYLYELAYFEMALNQVRNEKLVYPYIPGIYLNPSCVFLSFEYNIPSMIDLARNGSPALIEKECFICCFQNTLGEVKSVELTEQDLQVLKLLEDGPAFNDEVFESVNPELLRQLSSKEIILDLLKL